MTRGKAREQIPKKRARKGPVMAKTPKRGPVSRFPDPCSSLGSLG